MVKAIEKAFSEQSQADDRDVILSVNGVSKRFCRDLKRSLLYGLQDMTIDLLGFREESRHLRPREFWALQDVSFQLRRGEALGLVGKNGSGKSTLLRIIAGLIKPDSGSVSVKGRVAPLIALGAGFNPVLTGRENIYANMSILGLSKEEIDQRFDSVVEFAEIGDAIDAPVQTYSSGMAARLGFSSAIHTEPEILLIDEVLAVGDVKFRVKCVRKLYELRQKGTSIIMVSHNHDALATICNTGVYLSKGISLIAGGIRSVMHQYESDIFVGSRKLEGRIEVQLDGRDRADLSIRSITLKNHENTTTASLLIGRPAHLIVGLNVARPIQDAWINFQIDSGDVGQVIYISSQDDQVRLDLFPGEYDLSLSMPYLTLGPGNYTLRILVRREDGSYFDRIDSFEFAVEKTEETSYTKFFQPHTWKIAKTNARVDQ